MNTYFTDASVVNTIFYRLAARGLNRQMQHMLGRGRWAMIAAHHGYRGIMPGDAGNRGRMMNNEDHGSLEADLRKLGYGFFRTQGAWTSSNKVVNKILDTMPGASRSITEDSIFVIGISEADAVALGKKYDQDAILFGQNGQFKFVDTTGDKSSSGPWMDVKSSFEHVTSQYLKNPDGSIKPNPIWESDHSVSPDDRRWRFADPAEHQKLQPSYEEGTQAEWDEQERRRKLTPGATHTASLKYVPAGVTHVYYEWRDNPRFIPQHGIAQIDSGFVPPADKCVAWIPLCRI